LVLLFWTVSAFAVIALCLSVRQTDARLARGRKDSRYAKNDDQRPSPEATVE
jgi:hypothetical protein